ncbi:MULTISPECIES: DPP IV N-terminal domain-containing protein [unclassified Arcicella]|uniref:S9 family peptidase n=1 Tax=unclassified Arcicella TaxID=2644986 RepID=UPI0028616919|nr:MULTISPECIES: DPP IV N-terminal domain-containing protein [unclassified Arcicella]MDR6564444.1 dipeptidyl aminopeptidase/acylaminoacyl peptidase [Arcicella sp. BE51]MDR6814303.1 dipeptidyl aminopeptidase/acylaminoacyl peptidase [Arcicella sp. BE140]MDR6825675.1 dipeptidyl aminopeptidase/acylaminoacyl peptidase [Arcicella sp. BE139]
MRKLSFILMLLLVASVSSYAQHSTVKANYALAAKFSAKKLNKMIFSTSVDPHWLKKSDRFWYVYETTEGKKWYIVDPLKAEKKLLFDNEKLAAAITKIVKDPFDAQHLGLDSMRFVRDENWIQFEVKSTQDLVEKKDSTAKKDAKVVKEKPKVKKVFYFEYNLNTTELVELSDFKKPKKKPVWASISPDGNTIIFGKKQNLYLMDKLNYEKALKNEEDSTIVEIQLTKDGVENFGYHRESLSFGDNETNVDKEKNKNKRKPASIFWSPDSKKFVMTRTDNRKVKDIWVINSVADPRPTLETYKYWLPGEKDSPIENIILFDVASKSQLELNADLFKDQSISIWNTPPLANTRDDDYRANVWLGTKDKFYLTRASRDLKSIDVMVADVTTNTVKPIIEERMNTYLETRKLGLVNGGKELIHWSERDGWGHFYLYDETGKLKNQITSGAFHTEEIIGIDEKKRVLYFTANNRESNEDPYYLHTYRVNFDGTGLKLLNEGNFDHASSINDNQLYFVDNFSRVNTTPKAVLYNTDGKKLLDLETTDLSSLLSAGYKFPQTFKVKADDGITDLYGVMYKPYDFDSTKKYPIIEYVYPGPQTESVNKSFSKGMDRIDRLAQLGFIVITVGNRGGNPARSKWYHNYGYGNLRDYGLADKKAAIEQLTDRFSFIDINKVGIHGHSGGGFMSTAAMLVYPDFFKAAVSNAGNHDNSIYNRWWSEKHHGVKEIISEKNDTSFVYSIEKNPEIAKNLKGKLLLIHGEIDNNVHPANTIRVVNALIKANKRFEMLTLPTQRHGFGDMTEYFFWKMADHFTKYLLDDFSDRSVDIEEMNKEIERKR